MGKPPSVAGEHDRMIAAMIMIGKVCAVDLKAGAVRVQSSDGWVSPWVRWHGQAAGKARHWRAPSMDEQGTLLNASGVPSLGRFIPGLFSEAGAAPDDRDHVEVWSFDDGGSLVYDWQAKSYAITLPTGTVTIKVGSSTVTVTDDTVSVDTSTFTVNASAINLVGAVEIEGPLHVTGNVLGDGTIIDTGGNTPNHKH